MYFGKNTIAAMNDPNLYQRLCYEHEVLWARYEIREHYLKTVVQEVYQGTGQILSMVRVQLSLLSVGSMMAAEKTREPGQLVGKAIHDLRDMCRYFTPDTALIEDGTFVETIRHELSLTGIPITPRGIKVKGEEVPFFVGTELIVFRMLQEILSLVKEKYKDKFSFTIEYVHDAVSFLIAYVGAPIKLDQAGSEANGMLQLRRLSLQDRAKVINGRLQIVSRTNNTVRIKLLVPFKTPFHE